MHGLAVNVDQRSLENFSGIVPCGLEGREVCCINDFLDEPISVHEFAGHLKLATVPRIAKSSMKISWRLWAGPGGNVLVVI